MLSSSSVCWPIKSVCDVDLYRCTRVEQEARQVQKTYLPGICCCCCLDIVVSTIRTPSKHSKTLTTGTAVHRTNKRERVGEKKKYPPHVAMRHPRPTPSGRIGQVTVYLSACHKLSAPAAAHKKMVPQEWGRRGREGHSQSGLLGYRTCILFLLCLEIHRKTDKQEKTAQCEISPQPTAVEAYLPPTVLYTYAYRGVTRLGRLRHMREDKTRILHAAGVLSLDLDPSPCHVSSTTHVDGVAVYGVELQALVLGEMVRVRSNRHLEEKKTSSVGTRT